MYILFEVRGVSEIFKALSTAPFQVQADMHAHICQQGPNPSHDTVSLMSPANVFNKLAAGAQIMPEPCSRPPIEIL
jgi:hypothetical protein